ncbi:MAG: bifunctional folylpolyglutamate synthase/dihydrofolate synthase [Defluviitaleaceae bacterium]|nr:bifunctional folylpolyglutamate synthase/dihydrofolate synthase [Defluviitaleaceae bacterium]
MSEIKLGLERTLAVLEVLGNPHERLKFVHIAGTNGKGSTAAMVANILKKAGYKVGLYTSPYVSCVTESMSINDVNITKTRLDAMVGGLLEYINSQTDKPTEFEIMTPLAFQYFLEEKCDIVVLEVGLGGRLDATNVIGSPEVAVITPIGLDHMEFLGGTVESIAGEKAGIIKTGTVCVCHAQVPSVLDVIRKKCAQNDVELRVVTEPETELKVSLIGAHQRFNAAVAIQVVNVLRQRAWNIPPDAVTDGLATVKWAGRFEILSESPLFALDGAHNAHSVQSVVDTLVSLYKDKRITFIYGVLADKDYKAMTEILLPVAENFITITPDSPRALPASKLADYINSRSKPAVAYDTIKKGVAKALHATDSSSIICALGSLYIFQGIRDALKH